MMNTFLCDVIVLTWNHLGETKKFFDSLLPSTNLPIRIILVDNASTDGTREYLKELKASLGDKLELILNDENVGFVRGVNQGFSYSKSPHVCLANNDLIFTKGWLDEMMAVLEKYPSIGMLNPSSNTLGLHPKAQASIDDLAFDLKRQHPTGFAEMPFCVGFCMVMRRDILDKNRGLSQDYIPMFFEDTDISMKAKELGYAIGVARGAYVWHKEHGSFKRGSASDNIFKKSRNTFERKWGKILRIAWVENNNQDLNRDFKQVLLLGQKSNYVTVYVKNTDANREEVFNSANAFDHMAIGFKKFKSYPNLVWGLIIKKKKFDLIITKSQFLRSIVSLMGQKAALYPQDQLIANLKKVDR